ncbi:MAG: hypothetical protein ACFFBI_10185 [Promethearchaeota archaeon]
MPDEFDFKKYESIEEYSKTLEGTKYLHSLYLKAVNHPIRREILTIVNKAKRITREDLIKSLIDRDIIRDESTFDFNMDYLIKAFCINRVEENTKIYFEITQSGQVVDYLED